jgi:hypothetical protein
MSSDPIIFDHRIVRGLKTREGPKEGNSSLHEGSANAPACVICIPANARLLCTAADNRFSILIVAAEMVGDAEFNDIWV